MNEATLGILITAQDQATPKLQGLQNTLTSNRTAIRELAMGVSYLGTTFLGLGIALQRSNSTMAQSIGNTAIMVGAVMSAIGASAQFVSAIARMVHALKVLNIQQIITQALSGPMGWATLLGGAAIAGGTIAGVAAYSRSQTKAEKQTTVNVKVQGSVVTTRQLGDEVRKQIILNQQRNVTSGIK